jgi:hypothetical protein
MSAITAPEPNLLLPLEPLPEGWQNETVVFRDTSANERRRIEMVNTRTGLRYLHDPLCDIALKCFLLFLATPFYLVGYTAWHTIRLPVVSLCHPTALLEQIWTIVRAPFYCLKLHFYAVYGIFNPLEGRAGIGAAEAALHQTDRRHDWKYGPQKSDFQWLREALTERDFRYTHFLAFCMQPFGKTSDPHIISHTRLEVRV